MSKKLLENVLQELSLIGPDTDSKDVDITDRLNPCISCGGEGSVEMEKDNVYINDDVNFTYKAPAYICKVCKNIVYSPKVYKEILEAEEAFQGRPYVRVTIKNGSITRYSVH